MDFDPVQFKTTTRQQWEDAAEAWHRWEPTLESWLGEATQQMLDAAGVTIGSHVLDVAAGAGGQTLAAARRTGSEGRVLATDISPTILTYAAKSAAVAGFDQVETLEADAEDLEEVPAESFDAVISRLGLMYLPDQRRGLEAWRRTLRGGGRAAVVVFSTADRNQFFSLPVSIIRSRAQLPPPPVGRPGPFSLGDPDYLASMFHDAGFEEVKVDAIAAPLHLPSAAECARFERESFGALHQMLAGVPADQHDDIWNEITEALRPFETADGFVGPCELLVGSGRA